MPDLAEGPSPQNSLLSARSCRVGSGPKMADIFRTGLIIPGICLLDGTYSKDIKCNNSDAMDQPSIFLLS